MYVNLLKLLALIGIFVVFVFIGTNYGYLWNEIPQKILMRPQSFKRVTYVSEAMQKSD